MSTSVSWLQFDTDAAPVHASVSWLQFDTTAAFHAAVTWIQFDTAVVQTAAPSPSRPEVFFTTSDFFADFPRFRRRKRRDDESIVAIFGH